MRGQFRVDFPHITVRDNKSILIEQKKDGVRIDVIFKNPEVKEVKVSLVAENDIYLLGVTEFTIPAGGAYAIHYVKGEDIIAVYSI